MIFNLTSVEKSDIKFKVSKYPDGQQNVVITGSRFPINEDTSVEIRSHFSNFKDLELINCAVACLKELGVSSYSLYTPYFLGARSDEMFEDGGNYYLEDVICPLIKSLGFSSVTVMDPHSNVLRAALRPLRFVHLDTLPLVTYALENLYGSLQSSVGKYKFVSPDGGSLKKVYKIEKALGYTDETVIGSKSRDANGQLTKINLSENYVGDKDLIWLDDICDGGRTFNEQAAIVKSNPDFKGKCILVVTHGIFSAGFDVLSQHFEKIYTTNSYKREFSSKEVLVTIMEVI